MRARTPAAVPLAVATVLAALTGCGGGEPAADPGAPGGATVYAAASLAAVLPEISPGDTYSFAGSDRLAFQIEQGARADVFASANTDHPDRLFARGLVERPVVFARTTLVVVMPAANPAGIRDARDLARPGVRLVVGAPTVPVGAYTRTALRRLRLTAALRNVVSEEADARAVVAKVALGEADAGVAYRTDIRAAGGSVRALEIPRSAQPAAAYSVAVVRAGRHPERARAFVRLLRGPTGRRVLARYGFRPEG